MPKQSKKQVFRGTKKQEIIPTSDNTAEADTIQANTFLTAGPDLPSTSAAQSPTSSFRASIIKDKQKQTAQKKISSTGFRIIDLECLSNALALCNLQMCCKEGVTIQDEDESLGWCSKLSFVCLGCGSKKDFRTSKVIPESAGVTYEVNRRAVYAASEIGVGREAIEDFTAIMGLPPPSKAKSWYQHVKVVNKAAQEEFDAITKEAGLNLRRALGKESRNEILDVAVTFDGSWHHRGFTSSHGIGVLMSVVTGEVLDAVSLSKDCSKSLRNPNADADWIAKHKESGECEQNFDGPSTSMETESCRIVWGRSIEKHNMRYTTLLSDGDNKTEKCLNEELKPYGSDVKIDKLECVNHVNKRMGTGLRNLRKDNKNVTGGRGGLTDAKIKKLGEHYRNAIMKNVTTSNEESVIDKHVKDMEKDILASLHHSVYHRNPATQHKYCSPDWCKYQQDKVNKTQTYDHEQSKKTKLPATFLKEMLPLYKRLTDNVLLRRCVMGLTQNQNESFNATVWAKCPKEKRLGANSVARALHLATATWNKGKLYDKMLIRMNLKPDLVI